MTKKYKSYGSKRRKKLLFPFFSAPALFSFPYLRFSPILPLIKKSQNDLKSTSSAHLFLSVFCRFDVRLGVDNLFGICLGGSIGCGQGGVGPLLLVTGPGTPSSGHGDICFIHYVQGSEIKRKNHQLENIFYIRPVATCSVTEPAHFFITLCSQG